MREQASQDPGQRGSEIRRGMEAGSRGYGRAIDCGGRLPDAQPEAARHGRGVREREGEEIHFLRG
jgi:hypothetical protein